MRWAEVAELGEEEALGLLDTWAEMNKVETPGGEGATKRFVAKRKHKG